MTVEKGGIFMKHRIQINTKNRITFTCNFGNVVYV